MTRRVQWSRAALDDLKAQIAYIADDDPAAARRIADRIRDTAATLERSGTGRPGRVAGTSEKLVVGLPYVIAFTVTTRGQAEVITVLRLIHTARNWPAESWPD